MTLFNKNFIGANIAFVLGVLCIGGGASQQNSELLVAGVYMILGSLAYGFAKKRKLKVSKPSKIRFAFELIAIAFIIVSVLFTNGELLYRNPVVNLIIPIWAVIAYLVVSFKK